MSTQDEESLRLLEEGDFKLLLYFKTLLTSGSEYTLYVEGDRIWVVFKVIAFALILHTCIQYHNNCKQCPGPAARKNKNAPPTPRK